MSNTIMIELCTEDRARLDRLAEALERRTCDRCVTTAIEALRTNPETNVEVETPPGEEPPSQADPVKKVDRAELRAKVIELSAKGFKDQTKDIVRAYAQTVTTIPEDKIAECYEKLVALEG